MSRGWSTARSRVSALWGAKQQEKRQVAWVDPSTLSVFQSTGWDGPIPLWQAMQVAAVHTCVTSISDHVGELDWSAYRGTTRLPDQPTIIRQPDPFEPVETTRRRAAVNMLGSGAASFYLSQYGRDGRPTTATLIPPFELAVSWNEARTRRVFRWRGRTLEEYPAGARGSQILYVPMFLFPDDPLTGWGPVQLGRATIREALAQDNFSRDFFTRGAVVDGVIMSEDDLSPDEVNLLRSQWDSQQGGRRGPPVITGGGSFQETSYSNRNSQLIESRQHMVQTIARFFGYPAPLLNAQMAGASLTYRNQEGIWTEYIRQALWPVLGRLSSAFNLLLPSTQHVRFAEFELLRADVEARARAAVSWRAANVYTENELREQEGLAPIPGSGPVPADPTVTEPVTVEPEPDAEVIVDA